MFLLFFLPQIFSKKSHSCLFIYLFNWWVYCNKSKKKSKEIKKQKVYKIHCFWCKRTFYILFGSPQHVHTNTNRRRHFCAFSWARFWRCAGVWLSVRCSEWSDCSVWVGTNKTLPSVYTIITMPVTAFLCQNPWLCWICAHMCVCVCVCGVLQFGLTSCWTLFCTY